MRIGNHAEMLVLEGGHSPVHPVLLWDDTGHLLLIDTGFPGQLEQIRQAIEKCGFSLGDLTHILLTHQDMDHIGCLRELKAEAPKAVTCCHREEAPYISGEIMPIKTAQRMENLRDKPDELAAFMQEYARAKEALLLQVDKTVEDGALLDFDYSIKIIHTPGHTPGHICVYVDDIGLLVTGDATTLENGNLMGPNPVYTLDMELALQSLAKMKNLPIRQMACYHGGYYKGGLS